MYQYLGIKIQITHFTFQLSFFNIFHIKEFKIKILRAIFSGTTERRRKLEILEI